MSVSTVEADTNTFSSTNPVTSTGSVRTGPV